MPINDVTDAQNEHGGEAQPDPAEGARSEVYGQPQTRLAGSVEQGQEQGQGRTEPELPEQTRAATEHMEYNRIFQGDGTSPAAETSPELKAHQDRIAELFGSNDPQKTLGAVDSFVDAGIQSFNVTTRDGKSYSFRMENVDVNGRTNKQMTHLFVTPQGGREQVAMRGVELQNPQEGGPRFDQQRNARGERVSFAGNGGGVMESIQGDLDGATLTMTDKDGKEVKATFVKGDDGKIQIKMESPEAQPRANEIPSSADIERDLKEHPDQVLPRLSDPNTPPEYKIKMLDKLAGLGVTHIDVKDASGRTHTFQPVVQQLENGVRSVQLQADGKTVMRGLTRGEDVAPQHDGDNALPYYDENKAALDFDWSNSEVTLRLAPGADGAEREPIKFPVGKVGGEGTDTNRTLAEAAKPEYAENPPWQGSSVAGLFSDRSLWSRGSTAAVASVLEKSGVPVKATASASDLASQMTKLVESGQYRGGVVTDASQLKDLPPGAVVIARQQVEQGGSEWPDGKRYASHTALKADGDSMYHISNRPGDDSGLWRKDSVDSVLPGDKFTDYMVFVPNQQARPETPDESEAQPQVEDKNLDMASLLRHPQHGLGLDFITPDASDTEVDTALKAKVAEGKGWSVEEGGNEEGGIKLEVKPGDIFVAESGGQTRIAMARQEQDGTTGIIVMNEGRYARGTDLAAVFQDLAEGAKIRRYRYAPQEGSQTDDQTGDQTGDQGNRPAFKSLFEALKDENVRKGFGLEDLSNPADNFADLDKQLETLAAEKADRFTRESQDKAAVNGKLQNQQLEPGTFVTAVDKATGETRVAAVGSNRQLYVWGTDGTMSSTTRVEEAFAGMNFDNVTVTARKPEAVQSGEPQDPPEDTALASVLKQEAFRKLYGLEWLPEGISDGAALDAALEAKARQDQNLSRRELKREDIGRSFDFEQFDIVSAMDRDGAMRVAFYERGRNFSYMASDGTWKTGTFAEVFPAESYQAKLMLSRRRQYTPGP
ncbi:MAG: hypothetical protein IPM23_14320 [Candidatus Melainabacteria bacterium]|nr:hypothetical protein [Candidatus Melainabacteria bacterium]